ncbi:peptidase-like protein [Pochonia chlamydosporia 170]|uniref:tripeptidyl-peptidase II n=1 Tax=Pochonia chlamydosporia 170 TaxID=1380566 RepID=A0A179F8P6_METCM|nr:peptidase-like protein [Pochonia chlamydosporia 170]OAQ61651.1 peptidase-like protein [Pochonia chlamydosporia 170]
MKLVFGLCCLFGNSLAAVVTRLAVVEHLAEPPRGWTRLESANPSQTIRLSIALESDGQEVLERTVQEVSDPNHPRYGQHLSRDAALTLIRPQQDAVDAVRRWLLTEDITEGQIQVRGLFVDVTVTIGTAERVLSTKYDVFQNTGRKAIGTLAYSVPADVRPHITSIQPTTFFEHATFAQKYPTTRRSVLVSSKGNGTHTATPRKMDDCKNNNTPSCLRNLYRMDENSYTKPHPKSLLGVVGFSGQTAQFDQLEKYLGKYASHAKGAKFTVELINNGTNTQGTNYPSGEANMDIQIAVAMAYRVPVRFYSTGGGDHDFIPDLDLSDPKKEHVEPWVQFLNHLLALPDRDFPQVMSISYGVNEQNVPKPHALRICELFGLLTVRGMSIIIASGDQGPGVSCQSNDGTKRTKFLPAFPGGCPYITSVGATESTFPEKAVNFSSGGFSEYWPRPAWQESQVSRYLKAHGGRWKGYYNNSGRGFPDVAAQGLGYPIFNHDKIEEGGGTSASAPLFASMIAIINDNRMKKGKPPLGFLNPWLYLTAKGAFTDITQGRSKGCQGTSFSGAKAPVIPGAGWDAVEGWDPVTGLGTPLFDKLQKLGMR